MRTGATQLITHIPDVLDAPDNKVNPRPRCRTSVANEGNPRVCDLRCNIPCVCARSRFRWCYTRGHMTQYHTTAAVSRMLHWDASCTTNSGRLLPASMLCDTTRFHYVGKRQQRLSRSLARAREISYDCCTARRMARKELTGGCTQAVRLIDSEGA